MSLIIQKETAGPVASKLLEIGAIRINYLTPFIWSSGWKAPIYCDNRLSLSFPEVRSYVKNELTLALKKHYELPDLIAGVATAGIPQGALVADMLNLPFAYVRPKSKDHGLKNLIEGHINSGQKVVLIEDLISTGGSSLKAVQAVRDVGAEVVGMVAIFTYGFGLSAKAFEQAKVPLVCLSDFDHLLEEALKSKFIDKDKMDYVKSWRLDPANWR
ncbi:MAG: orotate phosphoribosyltransferase [Flammeovirgaceae bacterium]|nr:orotate phosphoribosyltransferase [Flammeovirgaceae bacterium]